ncbi:hypothetical protein VTH82DRAFT_7751 [Thermothelomyces myriococcoides]
MMRQHSRGSRSSGDQIPVQPTPDLQEIYNEMRELEEQLTEQLTRESLSQVPDGRAAALCPSSPSQATTPSLAETPVTSAESAEWSVLTGILISSSKSIRGGSELEKRQQQQQ